MEKIRERFRANLLLVDDHPINRDVMRQMLELMGCNVAIAEHGRAAIELLERQRFDLVFLDLQMPEMNGFELAKEIRRRGLEGVSIPIVAVSANLFSERDHEECRQCGMQESLAKPVSSATLAEALERHLPPGCVLS